MLIEGKNMEDGPELRDVTKQARKFFAAVLELEERFGIFYVIDVLKGSSASHVRPQHKSLQCFAAGREWTRGEWRSLANQLILQGFIERSRGLYPAVSLTGSAQAVLAAETKVYIPTEALENTGVHNSLYGLLYELRDKLAATHRLAPYLIVTQHTLVELAVKRPSTIESLKAIKGLGKIRMQKFGDAFLDVIRAYAEAEDHKLREETLSLVTAGKSAHEVAAILNLPFETIELHIEHFLSSGQLLLEQVMNTEKVTPIREAIQLVGNQSVDTIQTIVGPDVDAAEIRYVIAQMSATANEPWQSWGTYYLEEIPVFVLE